MIENKSDYCTLNQEVLPKWIDALRTRQLPNGKIFCQTRETLMRKKSCSMNGYCCLGVLTQLYIDYGLDADGSVQYHLKNYLTIPEQVAKWAGFDRYYDPDTCFDKFLTAHPAKVSLEASLAGLNDNEKRTFKTIADILEKNFLE